MNTYNVTLKIYCILKKSMEFNHKVHTMHKLYFYIDNLNAILKNAIENRGGYCPPKTCMTIRVSSVICIVCQDRPAGEGFVAVGVDDM